jgi:hypothetical protein
MVGGCIVKNRTINIGDKVICSESEVVGMGIRFYHPTSCEEQTLVKTEDGRRYHAPTSMWSIYKDGYKPTIVICDECHEKLMTPYALEFANNNGLHMFESIGKQENNI